MIRIAAVGDLHYGEGSTEILRPSLRHLQDRADLLLLAGDLTRCGGPEEVKILADELRGLPVPVVAVLGNQPEMKAFVAHTKLLSDRLERALAGLDADLRIALLHYSPIEATLEGERLEIYPFLGSYLLAEAVDNAGADLVLHGHAHHGAEKGRTPAGIPVRNVAQPVIRHAYNVYTLDAGRQTPQAAAGGIS